VTLALQAVSLEVSAGSIVGLLGPNGAGKTTLLKILAGLILPTAGTARVGGWDTRADERKVKGALGLMTSDERSFYWRLTGRQNLRFFGSLHGLHGRTLEERIRYLLHRLELEEPADKPFGDYSSGMKQRLAMARALLHDPPVLLLDEPTRSLDPISAKHLRRFIADELHGREGKALLLATHNLPEAEQLCERVAVLSGGRILAAGRAEELPQWGTGRDAYVVVLSGLPRLPEDLGEGLTASPLAEGKLRVAGEFGRDGTALSRFLGGVLARGGTVVSCTRRESGLQELFDRMDEEQG
jgi:ABC-2 type transport system ATP-binding protein